MTVEVGSGSCYHQYGLWYPDVRLVLGIDLAFGIGIVLAVSQGSVLVSSLVSSPLTWVLKVAMVLAQGKLHTRRQLQSEVTARSSASNTYTKR